MSVSTVQDVGRPLITIPITCYNGEDTIQRAVESALNQTWRRREIVIVDDGSTDGSLWAAHDYCRCVPEEPQTDEQRRAPEMFA
jgi:glycosyltransferase involved in cell wall biosynthesis